MLLTSLGTSLFFYLDKYELAAIDAATALIQAKNFYLNDNTRIHRLKTQVLDNITDNTSIAIARQVISHLLLALVVSISNIAVGMH